MKCSYFETKIKKCSKDFVLSVEILFQKEVITVIYVTFAFNSMIIIAPG